MSLSLAIVGFATLLADSLALAADVPCAGGYCEGTTGDDAMTGSPSADEIYGLGGCDTMYGGSGPDRLQGDERTDTLNGGRGNDSIEAKHGEKDFINCGRGPEDVAFFDRSIDSISNCEVKNPPVG